MYYCYALWIPCLSPCKAEIIGNPGTRTIKDVPHKGSCTLSSKIDVHSRDIEIHCRFSDSHIPEVSFTLHHLNSLHSGLVIYEIDADDSLADIVNHDNGKMHPAVYHYVKSIFHRHVNHHEESDSLLSAYTSPRLINPGNSSHLKAVYSHYIDEYIEKFDGAYNTMQALLARVVKLTNREKAYRSAVRRAKSLIKVASIYKGEAAFALSLLRSSRNIVRVAQCNRLYDSISSIEMLATNSTDAYTILNNQYNNRLSRWGINLGLAGILLTCVIEVISCVRAHNDKHDNKATELSATKLKIEELTRRADSLNVLNEAALERFNDKTGQ